MSMATTLRLRRTATTSGRAPWEERPSTVGQAGKGTVIVLMLAAVLVPLWVVVLTSFSTAGAIGRAGGLVIWPDGVTLDAYTQMLTNSQITKALTVSLLVTVIGTAVSMVVSVLCAYGLSRSGSMGHRLILLVLVLTMFLGGGMIPTYLVVTGLGGYGQYWALILPSAISVFNILVLRNFYAGTSAELIDAAKIDGAGDWRTLWSVVLPTSKAVTAVITWVIARRR